MKERRIAILLALCMVLSLTMTACRGQEITGGPVLNPTQARTAKMNAATTAQTTVQEQNTSTAVPVYELTQIKESWKNKTDPITFTLASSNHDGTIGKKWAEDEISRMVTDMTGVKLELIYGKEKTSNDFYDTLMVSGELPDLVYLIHIHDSRRMARDGNAAALDVLAKQYCPDFWDSLEGKEIIRNTESDGHVYTLRNGYISDRYYDEPTYPVAYTYPLCIRTDLLEKLGEDMPTSVEGLEALLRKVRDRMTEMHILTPMIAPDITSIPVAGWMGVYNSWGFLGRHNLQWDPVEKRVITAMGDPNWYEYLMEMNRWHRDGLITLTEYDGDPRGQMGTNTFMQGDSIISFARASHSSSVGDVYHTIRREEEAKTDPKYPVKMITEALTWQGEDRETGISTVYDYGYAASEMGLFISKTCHDKERAILFYQFLRSEEGAKLTHWGIEGIHYNLDEEDHVVMTEGNRRDIEDLDMFCLSAISAEEASPVGYWAMVDNPMVRGQYAASPIGAERNQDILRLRSELIEAGVNYKNKIKEETFLPLEEICPQEGEQIFDEYVNLYYIWKHGVNEMVCAESMELAEARWTRLQEELQLNGLKTIEDSLTLRFMEVMERYQNAGYFTEIEIR